MRTQRLAGLLRSSSVLSFLLLPACVAAFGNRTETAASPATATRAHEGKPAARPDDEAAAASKVAAAERALVIAQMKLEKSRTDLANQEAAGKETVVAAEADCELSARALANFEVTSRLRLEREKMGLQAATDGLAEAEEELAQLELMYEKSELADKTKELVIRRGQRRLERSKRSLELQRQALANLEGVELVQERSKLQLDAESKKRALARATRDTAAALADKKLALQTQEHEVVRLEEELAAAKKAATKPTGK
jgi:hypothetical protein